MLQGLHDMVESKLMRNPAISGKLTSTFRSGNVKMSSRGNIAGMISLNLLRRMQQLAQMIKSRREFRSEAV